MHEIDSLVEIPQEVRNSEGETFLAEFVVSRTCVGYSGSLLCWPLIAIAWQITYIANDKLLNS